jgi:hypothetical protein
MNKPGIKIAALALLLAFSATSAHSAQPLDANAGNKVVLAKVGERTITREDLIHMIQIEKFYGSPALSEADALVIVMQDAIAHEVAHSVGVDATPPETPVNFPFVNQFTPSGGEDFKAQQVLPPNEQAFHVSHTAYAQLYVVPKIIDRRLRRYFSTAADLHPAERASIEQALRLVISGNSFTQAANATGLLTAQHQLENKAAELPAALIPKLPVGRRMAPNDTLFDILDRLTPGTINANIIEYDGSYRVLRLVARNGQRYTIETIEAIKPPFEKWLKERARTLRIMINDKTLKREVKLGYPGMDWVERL